MAKKNNWSAATRNIGPEVWENGYRGFIYFIQMGDVGPIKIGYAKNCNKRLTDLQISNPYKLNLIYFTPANMEDEQFVHRLLRTKYPELCLSGEWYHPSQVVFNTIEDFKKMDARKKVHHASLHRV